MTHDQIADANRLNLICKAAKRAKPWLTQQKLAEACGWKQQSAVSQYVCGVIPLNFDALINLALALGVPITEISPSLSKRIFEACQIGTSTTTEEKEKS